MQAFPKGERQQQDCCHAMLDCQSRAQIHIRAAPLLIHRAGAHPGQPQQHCAPGTNSGVRCDRAGSHMDTLAHREGYASKTKREAEPLHRPHRFTEAEADECGDDRHGAQNQCDQSDVHAAGRREVHRTKLQRQRQGTDHGTGERRASPRPCDTAEVCERGIDRAGYAEAQHEQRERRGVVEPDSRRRVAGAPQQHEGPAQHPGRDRSEKRFLSHSGAA
jgi:hypothetical protein